MSNDSDLKRRSSLIYDSRKGGYLDFHDSNKVKYKVKCGIGSPMFMHYAIKALEGYRPEEMLQWLYNSVMEDYIEKDKIHSTLDGKVLVDKHTLEDLLKDYRHLHAYKDKNNSTSKTCVLESPWSYILLKEELENVT